jgi:hypothetical protein
VTIPIGPPLDSLGCFPSEFVNRQRILNLKVNHHGFPLLKLQDVFDDAVGKRALKPDCSEAENLWIYGRFWGLLLPKTPST